MGKTSSPKVLQFEKDEKSTGRTSCMEIYAAFVAAFSFLCIGLLRAYTSPAISSMKRNPEIFNTTLVPEKEVISWIASSPPLASFIGTLVAGPLLQYCGRQKTLILLTLPYIIGWALIGFALNVLMVMSGRILTGLGAGMATATSQLYVSECVRPEVRGMLGFLPSMMLSFGVLLGFSASTINVEWRELALIMGSLPLALFFMALTVPESPTWLIMKGKGNQATKALAKFRGAGVDMESIENEIDALKTAINQDKRKKRGSRQSVVSIASEAVVTFGKKVSNFCTLLGKRQIWLPAFIAVTLMMFQQLAGANVVIYFLSVILTDAEPLILQGVPSPLALSANNSLEISAKVEPEIEAYSVLDHNVGSVIVAAVQFAAFFLSLPLIDKMGRRILLIISAILMALSLGLLGFYFYCNTNAVKNLDGNNNYFGDVVTATYAWLPLTCLCIFIAAYSIGMGPVPFILMSEIFPAQARSYLCSLTSFSNHFFLFVVIKTYPMLVDWFSSQWTFWFYAGTSLASILLVVLIIPETKGKSLVEIEKGFTKESKPLLDRRDSYVVGLP